MNVVTAAAFFKIRASLFLRQLCRLLFSGFFRTMSRWVLLFGFFRLMSRCVLARLVRRLFRILGFFLIFVFRSHFICFSIFYVLNLTVFLRTFHGFPRNTALSSLYLPGSMMEPLFFIFRKIRRDGFINLMVITVQKSSFVLAHLVRSTGI